MDLTVEAWWNLINEEIKRKEEACYKAQMLYSWVVIDKNRKEFYEPES